VATSRTAVRLAAAVLAVSGVLGAIAGVGGQALADPSETTLRAQAKLDRLNDEVDAAVEDYNEGQIKLAKAQRLADATLGRQTQAGRRLAEAQRAVGLLAASAYRSGGGQDVIQVMTTSGTPEAFLERASALNNVARANAVRMRDLRAAGRELTASKKAADRSFAAVRALNKKLAVKKSNIEASVAEQEQLLARLTTADERATLKRAAAAQRAAAQRLLARHADRASREGDPSGAGDPSQPATSDIPSDVPVTGRGAAAVAFAYSQIGKPYSWGDSGLGAYDCSGLTMRSWAAAGVSLSHSSRAQIGEGSPVSRSQLQPGDLVFFGHPIHHVGMYVGNGEMINAPHSGALIGVRSMMRDDYAGAVRPG
jgi:cell wall-associated NlpC family hydrolase